MEIRIDAKLLRKQIVELEKLMADLPDDSDLWGVLSLLEALYDNEVK